MHSTLEETLWPLARIGSRGIWYVFSPLRSYFQRKQSRSACSAWPVAQQLQSVRLGTPRQGLSSDICRIPVRKINSLRVSQDTRKHHYIHMRISHLLRLCSIYTTQPSLPLQMTRLRKWFLFTFAKACVFTILRLAVALVSFPAAHIHQSCFYVGYFFLQGQILSSSSFSLSVSGCILLSYLSLSLAALQVDRAVGQCSNSPMQAIYLTQIPAEVRQIFYFGLLARKDWLYQTSLKHTPRGSPVRVFRIIFFFLSRVSV